MNREVPQDTSSNIGSLEANSRLLLSSFMSDESKSVKDTSSCFEDSEHYPKGGKTQSSKQFRRLQHLEHLISRTRSWSRGWEKASKSRANTFVSPKESDAVHKKAKQSIEDALNQVFDTIHFNTKRKETAVTLFAGNLDFDADVQDVMKSLRKYFRHRIRVSEIAIPNSKGQTKGNAFITLSWVQEALVDQADLCKFYSGVIQVKSRELYFQELHNDVADKARE
jgi:hypothetical protein